MEEKGFCFCLRVRPVGGSDVAFLTGVVLGDRRVIAGTAVHAFQVLIKPGETNIRQRRHPVGGQSGAGRAVQMFPGANQQLGGGVIFQALVDQGLAALKNIVEPAHHKGRCGDLVDLLQR